MPHSLRKTTNPNLKLCTLVYVRQKNNLLLGLKKRSLGKGKWNGFGGKVEPGETIEEGAIREVQEECGLHVKNLHQRGTIWFSTTESDWFYEVHVFETFDFSGEVMESEEMRPEWFEVNALPYELMWPDNQHWLPQMLSTSKYFLVQNLYLPDEVTICRHEKRFSEEPPSTSTTTPWKGLTWLFEPCSVE